MIMRTHSWSPGLTICSLMASSVALAAGGATAHPASSAGNPPCRIESTVFQGWQAQQISNSWVTLIVVPQNGGRLMQVIFGGHAYLFVNPKYAGKYLPPTQGKWFNYGGDKLWPLPEGDQDEQHWAGGSDVLDDGQYSFQVSSESGNCSISLNGPADPRTGLQFARTISLGSDSPQIRFHAVMKNASGHSIEWSVQSVSQYNTADPRDPSTYDHDFRAFTPANPTSSYLERYHVRFGPAENPNAGVMEDGLFTLRYGYLAAELWLDSPAGWLAVTDGVSGYAMVERFHYKSGAAYPGKASVIFWTNGPEVRMDSKGMPTLTAPKLDETPFYLEAELNSPQVRLDPGESYDFDTEWYPTRCGKEFETVTDAGLVVHALAATRSDGGSVTVTGSFGALFGARVIAHVYEGGGRLLDSLPLGDADPLKPLDLNKTIAVSNDAARISVHLEDSSGTDRGSLGEVPIR